MNKLARLFCLMLFLNICTNITLASQDTPPPSDAKRIISAGGSITELLYALDLGDKLIAVDSSSLYPPETFKLPKVGYFRSLSAEGLLSLNPDLIIAAKGAGPKAAINQVQRLGVDVKTYDQGIYTLEAWEKLVTHLGNDYDKKEEANTLIQSVTSRIEIIAIHQNNNEPTMNAIALLSIGQRGPVAAGKNTVPDLLFKLAGITNVAHALDGYKPFSTELLAQQKLDLVIIPSHVIDGLGGRDAVCNNPILKQSMPEQCNVFIMDGLLLMGFGSRLDHAVETILEQRYNTNINTSH